MKPSISVVIPTHQRPVYLDRAIQSVVLQNGHDCEIIVVDDNGEGTPDQLETQDLMQKYADKPQVKYVVQPRNMGGGAARNLGIQTAKSDYIGFLDDDDEWLPDFVQKHLDVFARSDADLVYCGFQRSHEDDNTIRTESAVHHRGFVFEYLLQGWCPISTSLFMIKRAVFDSGKSFDERFPSFQDFDCWLGIAKEHQFDYCDDRLLLKHGHGIGQISVNPVTRQKGLAILEAKWRDILSDTEWAIFEKTLLGFKKEMRRKEFLVSRQSEGVVAAIPKAIRYLTFETPRLREIARVVKNMIFPYR